MGLFSGTPEILSETERKHLSEQISEIEKQTSGELKISVQRERSEGDAALSLMDLALQHFQRLGMEKTRDKTGVLIFLLLSEHKLQILADAGINEKVQAGTWAEIAQSITAEFKSGKYFDGLTGGLSQAGKLLQTHFPAKHDDTDELSNDVHIS